MTRDITELDSLVEEVELNYSNNFNFNNTA